MTTPTLTIVGDCRGCDRPMIRQLVWQALDRDQRTEHIYIFGYSLCVGCYSRARNYGTLPLPAPSTIARRSRERTATPNSWQHARSDARRHMKQIGFAPTPKACAHDNGAYERRQYPAADEPRRTRSVELQCHECGQHLGQVEPDNPTLLTAPELAAEQAPAPAVQPWTWGEMRYDRGRPVRPKECPQGHPLGRETIIFGAWSAGRRRRTYTCRVCQETDPYIATWRPRATTPRPTRPTHTDARGIHAVVWSDGSLHVLSETWSNMALHHRRRYRFR